MIPVTKAYLPSREKLNRYLDGIYEREWLTNNGPLVQILTQRLEQHLGVDNLLLVGNGTLALQIAYRALAVRTDANPAEAITTPFTFVATARSLEWETITPVFVDVDRQNWTLDPDRIEKAITPNSRAIVPVHVFGNPCDVEAIQEIADHHQLKVIYDAAHAFDVHYRGESVLKRGDAATLSFHATKVFHTIEGGAIIFKNQEDLEKAKRIVNFGLDGPGPVESVGINAKMSEFQAAMGLVMLDEIDALISARMRTWNHYCGALAELYDLQQRQQQSTNNYGYFPVLAADYEEAEQLLKRLEFHEVMRVGIFPHLSIPCPY